ncbi:hypothetical protein BJY52DRAFT_1420673 [Lactarius psammicola]|nr:hypothetical protein BJY52DRAFT_1420673 [Lactarius psammicola]
MGPTSPPGDVAVQHVTDRRISSDAQDVPSLPFPTPVLNNVLPTEYNLSLLAPASPRTSRPQLSSAPDLGAAAKGEGSANAALLKETDALDPPSAIREYIIAPPDLPQSPSPSSVTEGATAGPS